jgi:hypothetical protein
METFAERYPESLGAGTEVISDDGTGNGAIHYGDTQRPNVVIDQRRDPAEVAAERARAGVRCGFCADIPTGLLTAIRDALQQKTGARR